MAADGAAAKKPEPHEVMLMREAALARSLGADDFRRVADARRAIWTGGFLGFGAGIPVGYVAGRVYEARYAAPKQKGVVLAATLLGACALSFVGATRAGQYAIGGLWDVFDRVAAPREYEQKRRGGVAEAQAEAALSPPRVGRQERPAGGATATPDAAADSVRYNADPYATGRRR